MQYFYQEKMFALDVRQGGIILLKYLVLTWTKVQMQM